MPKVYPSQALTHSYRFKQKVIRVIAAMLFGAALVALSLYANTFLSLPPAETVVAKVLGAVGGVTVIVLGFLTFKKAITTLNAQ